ncbi:EscI/YscI/HrpB family type III secretion system inner rod protein [Candidatus Pantoea multigeneris]|uniref:Uncharacterized protein n=1 Tax=Candidatus Pantoea multigeneris TaxID=2608357 RepID=A0ABX0RFR9_9GAMM|nr:EscI/YscI/HrpB family type III secretion system inner rod protein [Pantoea multigeneris]NIF23282.1 hypothetical protein [Pantoea multigeneris]
MYTENKLIGLQDFNKRIEKLNEETSYELELAGYDFRKMVTENDQIRNLTSFYENKRRDMEDKVTRSAVSANVQDLSAAAGAAREYYILNHLTAKVIGKGVQSIEKLTSMQ